MLFSPTAILDPSQVKQQCDLPCTWFSEPCKLLPEQLSLLFLLLCNPWQNKRHIGITLFLHLMSSRLFFKCTSVCQFCFCSYLCVKQGIRSWPSLSNSCRGESCLQPEGCEQRLFTLFWSCWRLVILLRSDLDPVYLHGSSRAWYIQRTR